MQAIVLEKWIEKEERAASRSKRRYLHFDRFINFEKNKQRLIDKLSDQERISKNSFYPFISTVLETPRYRVGESEDGNKLRVLEKKPRPISYAAHYDAFVYSWYSTLLTKCYQDKLVDWQINECVLAYLETGKCNIDYSFEVFDEIINRESSVAIAVDIRSFFDNLDHEILKRMWSKTIKDTKLPPDHFNLYKSLTNYSTVSKQVLDEVFASNLPADRYCTPEQFRMFLRGGKLIEKNANTNSITKSLRFGRQCGIPQGSPISAVLSNIYMMDFDIALNSFAKENGGVYRRYCDDIILVCPITNESDFSHKLNELIQNNELELNPKKTEKTYFIRKNGKLRGFNNNEGSHVYKNLQYLGFEFNGTDTYIRGSSMSKYNRRLRAEIRECLKAANGNNSKADAVFKKNLLKRFSSKGKRNFITYAVRAANNTMGSHTIRKQYNRSISKILKTFKKKQVIYNEKLLAKNKTPKALR